MNPVSYDIKDVLEANTDLGLVFATNLFIGVEPSAPVDCVTIYDTPSSEVSTLENSSYQYMSFQIRVRNASYEAGMELAYLIYDVLRKLSQQTVNTTYYSQTTCTTLPFHLGMNDNKCHIIFINFETQRR